MAKKKLRCRVGDLVFIIKGSPENLGKIGRVTGPWVENETGYQGDWMISAEGTPFRIAMGCGRGVNAIAWDDHLLPIRGGEPKKTSTRKSKPKPAVA